MSNYTLITDSGCDLSDEVLKGLGVRRVELSFREKDAAASVPGGAMSAADFYKAMREGNVFMTSAAPPDAYFRIFEEELRQGRDVLYIGMSTGISCTSSSASLAAKECSLRFPGRRVIALDSLCASGGLGLLLLLTASKAKGFEDVGQAFAYAAETAPKVSHWFTVDDLKYLRRGGRINAAAAYAASILNVKPVLHMDDGGFLKPVSRRRGRKQAIAALAGSYIDLAEDPDEGLYLISHGDCPEDAAALEDLLFRVSGKKAALITDIGPVIGAHSGPGTLALFFIGKKR